MSEKIRCEIFIAMNEDGDWVVLDDESEAINQLSENAGGYHARVVKVTVKMAPPKMTEAEVEVSDEAGETKQIEVEAAE